MHADTEVLRTGLMAATRYSIGDSDLDFQALALELKTYGLEALAPVLSELGAERIADIEFLEEYDLLAAGIRMA